MTSAVVVIGGGGHGKVLIEALQRAGVPVLGVLDPALVPGSRVLEVAVLGDDRWLEGRAYEGFDLVNGIGSLPGKSEVRRQVFERWRALGFRFAKVIHPAAIVASDVVLNEGAQIMAGAVMQPGVSVGADSIVNTRAAVDHDCRIGAHCHLAPGVTLSGGVSVGDGCHIGTGATVIQDITLGEASVIAAGATVFRNVAAGARYIPGKG